VVLNLRSGKTRKLFLRIEETKNGGKKREFGKKTAGAEKLGRERRGVVVGESNQGHELRHLNERGGGAVAWAKAPLELGGRTD